MRPSRYATLFILAVLLAFGPRAGAQAVGDCAPGMAEADLDVNDVRARVFNGGNLFLGNETNDGSGYLVPKATGHSPIYAANLWVGGLVDDELRIATAQYGAFEFWPGPLDAEGNPPADCSIYDRIYVVSRSDIARYLETGVATADLRDWPVDLGAPVLDGDGVAGNYNLDGGDEPAISGEQMAWWVMNDAGNTTYRQLIPMPMEVRVSAFATPSRLPALNQATFYRYEITYRGTVPLDSAYLGLWTDVDLGLAPDDFIGTDTTLAMSFAYGADDSDEIYGIPPAVGTKMLKGPVGLPNGRDDNGDGSIDEESERLGVTSSSCYFDAPGSPGPGSAYYDCMKGRWFRGEPLIARGFGYFYGDPPAGSDTVTIAFPGDPVTGAFWSEVNADGEGNANSPGDRWYTLASGPFRMEPGATMDVVFAIPFAQGTDRFDSIVRLREAARYIQSAYDLGVLDPQRVAPPATEPPLPEAFALRAAPNPFAERASIELTVADGAGPLRLAVYDVLGREVAVLADGVLAPGVYPFELIGTALPSGTYVVRLETGRQTESILLTHVD